MKAIVKLLTILTILLLLAIFAITASGCRESNRVSYNISKQADNFNVTRRLSLSYRHRIRIDAQTVIEIVSVGVVAEQIFYVIFCILNQLVVHKKHPHRLYHYGGGFVVFSSKEITSLLWQ